MLKQLWCWIWRGHERRWMYDCDSEGRRWECGNNYSHWVCINCNKTGISRGRPLKNYNDHETVKPKLNIVRFNKDA
jgi:predicted RNA-binding Zn-ribbon protein involved in translation (DUF1610 family)